MSKKSNMVSDKMRKTCRKTGNPTCFSTGYNLDVSLHRITVCCALIIAVTVLTNQLDERKSWWTTPPISLTSHDYVRGNIIAVTGFFLTSLLLFFTAYISFRTYLWKMFGLKCCWQWQGEKTLRNFIRTFYREERDVLSQDVLKKLINRILLEKHKAPGNAKYLEHLRVETVIQEEHALLAIDDVAERIILLSRVFAGVEDAKGESCNSFGNGTVHGDDLKDERSTSESVNQSVVSEKPTTGTDPTTVKAVTEAPAGPCEKGETLDDITISTQNSSRNMDTEFCIKMEVQRLANRIESPQEHEERTTGKQVAGAAKTSTAVVTRKISGEITVQMNAKRAAKTAEGHTSDTRSSNTIEERLSGSKTSSKASSEIPDIIREHYAYCLELSKADASAPLVQASEKLVTHFPLSKGIAGATAEVDTVKFWCFVMNFALVLVAPVFLFLIAFIVEETRSGEQVLYANHEAHQYMSRVFFAMMLIHMASLLVYYECTRSSVWLSAILRDVLVKQLDEDISSAKEEEEKKDDDIATVANRNTDSSSPQTSAERFQNILEKFNVAERSHRWIFQLRAVAAFILLSGAVFGYWILEAESDKRPMKPSQKSNWTGFNQYLCVLGVTFYSMLFAYDVLLKGETLRGIKK